MAYSKIILNGETLMDVTNDTVDAGNLLSGKTATKNSGAKVTGNIATKSSSDLTVSGATVTAPAGYYSATASKAVATTTHPNPTATIASSTGVVTASHTQGTGYVTGGTTTGTLNLTTQAAQTINTSTADQTIASNRWLTGTQTIKSVTTTNLTATNIAEGVTVKVGDANNASRITQITGTHSGETQYTATISGSGNSSYCYVTYNGTKYYSNNGTFSFKAGDTLTIYCRGNNVSINGEPVTLNSYNYTYTLPVGDITINLSYSSSTSNNINIYGLVKPEDTYEISSSGTFNVYGYSQAWVPSGAAATPAKTITTNPTMTLASTTGVVTAAYNGSSSITPTITSGYVTAGTAGTVSTTGTSTFQLTSKAAATYNTSTADQTVPSYRWLTGTQTIKSVTTSNLTAANIASGVVVKVGDANNASRITQVTGTYAGENNFDFEDGIITRNLYNTSYRSYYENSRVGTIGEYVFAKMQYPYSCYFPSASRLLSYAFLENGGISYCSAPLVRLIYGGVFNDCRKLQEASFPLATEIGSSAFQNCISLKTAYFPSVRTLYTSAFECCSALSSIYFPQLQSLYGEGHFRSCYALVNVELPNLSTIASYMFNWCKNLTTISLGNSAITSARISSGAFMVCYNLLSVYLNYGTVPYLQSVSVFYNSPISNNTTSTGGVYGSIYVPASLYNSYITASNWSLYSARIVSI